METVFENDGSLRDIYILSTKLEDWQSFLDFIKEGNWKVEFYKDSERTNYINFNASELFAKKNNYATTMTVMLEGLLVNCHFFSEDEIELDIDPVEVNNISRAESIFYFMVDIANRLNRDVSLTPENSPNHSLVRCRPQTSTIEYVLTGKQFQLPLKN